MSVVEELKKYKELLDSGIITQDEFDKKKSELLAGDITESSAETKPEDKQSDTKPKKPINKGIIKKIVIVACIIAMVAIGIFAGKIIVEHIQHTKRAAALETGISSIMNRYGLDTYTVKYVDNTYAVYAEGFESLTNGKALDCLVALDDVSVDDPCGDGKLEFGVTHVHPGLDVEYSYWRISSVTISLNEMYNINDKNYTNPGIYCDEYGIKCVYVCENW